MILVERSKLICFNSRLRKSQVKKLYQKVKNVQKCGFEVVNANSLLLNLKKSVHRFIKLGYLTSLAITGTPWCLFELLFCCSYKYIK